MRKFSVLAMMVAFLLALTLQPAAASDFYKVGVITSLSGSLATGGNITKQGYELWANTVNAMGGIEVNGKRYPVKLIYADAQSEPAVAASGAERLAVQEQIDFALGPYSSGVTLAAAPVLEKYKIPMITGSAESPLIWIQKFLYTFGTIPPVNFNAGGALSVIAGLDPRPKTIVIVGSNDAFSKATAEAFQAVAKEKGLKILKYNIVPAGQDLTPYLSAVRVLRPDVIAFGGHDEELIRLVKILEQINYTPKALIMHYGVTEPAFVQALGKEAEQVFGASVWTATLPTHGEILWKNSEDYANAVRKAYNVTPDYTMAGCSAAGIAFQVALSKIQAPPPLSQANREALARALESVDVQTFYGRVKFSGKGEYYHANVGLHPLCMQIQKGQAVIVGPKEYKEHNPEYPMTSWQKR
jgi:branched-chain amino acid transport system substrate-binding protein